MTNIFHIVHRDEWDASLTTGEFWPAESRGELFIHFSFRDQIVGVANDLFRRKEGLIILEVPLLSIANDVKIEGGFPHLYRPLKCSEVAAIHQFPPLPDGTFRLPDSCRA